MNHLQERHRAEAPIVLHQWGYHAPPGLGRGRPIQNSVDERSEAEHQMIREVEVVLP